MKDEFVNYQEPFVTHSESNKHKRFNLASKLVQLWNWLIESIIEVNKVKISSLKNRFGVAHWVVREPFSEREVYFESEAEVRKYLERRYYQ